MALTKEKISLVKPLLADFPNIKVISPSKFNWAVFHYLKLFVASPDVLATSLIQSPFEKTNSVAEKRKDFDKTVVENLRVVNRMYSMDESILDNYEKYRKLIVLFLANFKVSFDSDYNKNEIQSFLSKERMRYGLKLLEKNDISELRENLEDKFFQSLDPKTFEHYYYLLKFTRSNYFRREKEIKKTFQDLLKKNKINADIQSRLKSIFSIHKKITKKNILFSQVLDTIGLRFIVDDGVQCYKTMELIVSRWPILNNRIKDYVAVPKDNGYKSIHLTVLFEVNPVEIQIRTRKMHQAAQYGKASHQEYKNGNDYD